MKKFTLFAVLGLALSLNSFAQSPSFAVGVFNAWSYAYGVNPVVPALQIDTGISTTGAATIGVKFSYIVTSDGRRLNPFSTNNKISVGLGSNQETVTPSAVSCSTTPGQYQGCLITATFSNTHGQGEPIATGSYGLGEAVQAAHVKGGLVVVDGAWAFAGGTNATITSQGGYANVSVIDARGTASGSAFSYKSTGTSSPAAYTVTGISWY